MYSKKKKEKKSHIFLMDEKEVTVYIINDSK